MLIDAQCLGHHYDGGRFVLRGVDLQVRTGESLAIMGPSGSGKTTLLSVIGGLVEPTEGSVTLSLDASDAGSGSTDMQAPFAWVTQGSNLLTHRTAVDNVAIAALASRVGMRSARAAAARVLVELGLGDRQHVVARRLSGGEAQRVSIARAVVSERPVVLADEPTAQLDRGSADLVMSVLLRTCRDRALVVVTHDPVIAARADHMVRLEDGAVGR